MVGKKKKKEGPFAVLIALRRTCESGAVLIKAGAAESLPLANESCLVTSHAPPMDLIAPAARQGTRWLGELILTRSSKFEAGRACFTRISASN